MKMGRIFLFQLLLGYAMCTLVELGNFKLNEMAMQSKQRYVFSDLDAGEQPAEIRFDIGAYPMNYANLTNSTDLRLHVIVVDDFQAALLEEMMEVNQEARKANNFTLSYLFKPLVEWLPFYEVIEIQDLNGTDKKHQVTFN